MTAWVDLHPNGDVTMRCDQCRWRLESAATTMHLPRFARLLLAFVTAGRHQDEFCEHRDGQLAMDL